MFNFNDLDKVKEKLDVSSVGFVCNVNRKEYFVCSCGHSSHDYMTNKKTYVCPACGNRLFYEFDEIDNGYAVLGIEPDIIQDDENFLLVRLLPFGVCSDNMTLEYVEEETYYNVAMYDKKNKFFALVYLSDSDEDELRGSFNGIDKYFDDGYEIASLSAEFESQFDARLVCSYYVDFNKDSIEKSKLKDIFNIFDKYMQTGIDFDDLISKRNLCLEDMFVMLFWNNVKWINSWKANRKDYPFVEISFNGSYGCAFKEYKCLLYNNIDISKEKVEDVFGKLNFLTKNCSDLKEFAKNKALYQKMIDENVLSYVEDYVFVIFPEFSNTVFFSVDEISRKTKTSFEKVLKYFIRSMINGHTVYSITRLLNILIDEGYLSLINFNKSHSFALEKKVAFLKKNIFTVEEIEQLQQKPTLDTFVKMFAD